MKVSVFKRNTCRLCEGSNLESVFRLTPTPVGDDFVSAARLNEIQGIFPLDLILCRDCGNVQLLNVVNPEVIYGEYTYVSSVSLELPEHFRRYADDILTLVDPPNGSLVVEIGSNEGALLNFFKNKGMRVLGIDPARNIAQKATEAGIETIPTFFNSKLANEIKKVHGSAAIIIANNVIANIDDLSDVAEGIRSLLAPRGVFVMETSYLLDVVERNLLDTIFHEHLSYLSAKPLNTFFQHHGMELIDVQRVPTKGGSLRCIVQLAGGPYNVSSYVSDIISFESNFGIDRPEAFKALSERLENIKKQLLNLMGKFKEQRKTVACYGAAVGLTTMMYYFDLGNMVSFIVDDNPIKQNTFSPGYLIPVFSPQSIYDKKPDYVLILAWRYTKTIIKKHEAFMKQGGHFIVPLPVIKVI